MRADFKAALTKTRVALIQHKGAIFLSTLCLMMKQKVDNTMPTAATDGFSIFYNEDFFMSLSPECRITLVAHEVLHPALQHIGTYGIAGKGVFTDLDRLNRAGDYVINDFLVLAGFTPIPDWLHDIKYRGMTTLEVYRLLEQEDGSGGGSGSDPTPGIGKWGDLRDPNGPGGEKEDRGGEEITPAQLDQQIQANIAAAATAQQAAGTKAGALPAEVQEFIDGLLKPKLPMAYHLRRFFTAMSKNDYSWRRINRRFRPMLLPGMWSENLGHLAFAMDMSMSVSQKDIQRYVSELAGVMKALKPGEMTVIQFDTEIKSTHRIKSVREMANIELKGRGGTHIKDLMEWARKNKPTALVVFTDGEYEHPSFNPGCPVLWMIHGRSKEQFHCNFGQTILFDV